MRTTPIAAGIVAALLAPSALTAQDVRAEQFYYPGSFNWAFLESAPSAARIFHAFDYGHAVLSETLWSAPDEERAARRLGREYRYLTEDLLLKPPRFAVAEEAVAPAYVRGARLAQSMFHWAHVLHRQLYDVYADGRLTDAERLELGERITDYYLTSPLAFTSVPKSMELMDEQYYSQVFRQRHPRFNGLIWAYHWLQVGLYEPLITAQNDAERRQGIDQAVATFFAMVASAPDGYPETMPMTPQVAPEFTRRHPRAAAIFDNLHMMHDIISDILASELVPRDQKRRVIYEALAEFQDPTRNVMSEQEWKMMDHASAHHGAHHE